MTVKGSSVSTPKTTKTGNLKGKVEVEIFAVLAEDTASLFSYDTPTIKGTILATWPKLFIIWIHHQNALAMNFQLNGCRSVKIKIQKYTKAIHYVDLDDVKVLINDDLPKSKIFYKEMKG